MSMEVLIGSHSCTCGAAPDKSIIKFNRFVVLRSRMSSGGPIGSWGGTSHDYNLHHY